MTPADLAFQTLVNTLSAEPGITYGEGKGFGSRALKSHGKIFAMVARHGLLVMKLPRARVDELVTAGLGHNFTAGHGKATKEWLEFDTIPDNVLDLGREAARYASA